MFQVDTFQDAGRPYTDLQKAGYGNFKLNLVLYHSSCSELHNETKYVLIRSFLKTEMIF